MRRLLTVFLLIAFLALGAVTPPKEHFGFAPGDDYKLADYVQVASYFRKLATESGRIRVEEFGKSSEGRPMLVAFISSEANIKHLERWKEINRKLALGLATAEEAERFAREGKAIVWIDSGLHSTEVAPVQHAPRLAYRMLTDESEEIRKIRANVILMQVPVINPDGLQMTADWYKKNLGTPHELASLPWLYQKYSGHDNNRDYFMMNLPETRAVSRMLFQEWFPHIVYNQHQYAPFPARIFIPPYSEPLNPNIQPAVMEGINLIGSAMRERFLRESKPGVVSYISFDAWWNGGLRSAPAFHNMHGILTETSGYVYATPYEVKPAEIPARFSTGIPGREPSVFYPMPWKGGRWALNDAVEYMLTADMAILNLAARQPDYFLKKAWSMARAQIEAGQKSGPYAYVIAPGQHDPSAAIEMVRRLQMAGIEVHRATGGFTAGGKLYPAGTLVVKTAQSFRGYLVDLMEPQKYPEIRAGESGPVKRPYDLAGWTLSYQMGVMVDRIDSNFDAELSKQDLMAVPEPVLDYKQNAGFIALARALKAGRLIWRTGGGAFLETKSDMAKWELAMPKVGLYAPWTANSDTGWTAWVLDAYEIPFTELRNDRIKQGGLRAGFDVIILAQQSVQSILHGQRSGGRRVSGAFGTAEKSQPRPEHVGGIGIAGVRALEEFVRSGGTLVALDSAGDLPAEMFDIGVRASLRAGAGPNDWSCPGSLLRVTVDPSHPLGFGMPAAAIVTSTGGQAYDLTLLSEYNRGDREAAAVVSYAKQNLLASGWLSGEQAAAGRPAMVEARMGQGRVVLFGFRPQFRGQSFGTFKLLLNAIYLSSSKPL
ncbi:MAG TPA: M14 family metallopeptidase [Bryobacteraceae bacterium]|nr:M14 family metallopeptidase [Bryobacteraceae bacterium]